jgi:hypothetical protein
LRVVPWWISVDELIMREFAEIEREKPAINPTAV